MNRILFGALCLAAAAFFVATDRCVAAPTKRTPVQFNRDIRPILSDKCFHCHGPDSSKRKAGLRLDDPAAAMAERDGKRALAPGDPDHSEVYRRLVTTDEDDVMPPRNSGRTMTPQEIELVREWIRQGARYETHWAYVAPVRPPLPRVKNQRWPKNPVDHFVLAGLEARRWKPSPEASRATLIRRVTLDLTGLPPTPEEVDAFLADKTTDAYERLVDRLLASPRYGERMAIEWLDAARYADSNGYQHDGTRTMWPWRDWLIRALNEDKPFDELTVEMLAGDLLPNATRDQKLATGFHRNHMLNGEGGRIAEESRIDYVVDRVDTTATTWLGITLACARCHDHKYDPFSQRDYFRLFAFFNNVPETGGVDEGGMARPLLRLPTPAQEEKITALRATLADFEARAAAASADTPEKAELTRKTEEARKALEAAEKPVLRTMVMAERPEPRDTFVLIRGAWDQHGEKVTPGTPAILPPLPADAPANRFGLARWLVSRDNPLTARVTVNRHWEQFFGVGLVKTSEDFGVQGEWPIQKDLLDWLAVELMDPRHAGPDAASPVRPWSLKHLHRLIVTSATYRQSARVAPELLEHDPDNRLLARGPRFRLSSLTLRDQALAVGGLLLEKQGGPPVKPYQPPGIWEDMSLGKISYKADKGEALYRRSIYIFWRRTVGPTMLFDTSARQVCTVRLPRTNTPLQALVTLNETAYVEAARSLGELMMRHSIKPEDRIRFAFRRATARLPSPAELKILQSGYERLLRHYGDDLESAAQLLSVGESKRDENLDVVQLAACTGVANVILNLDEVLTKE